MADGWTIFRALDHVLDTTKIDEFAFLFALPDPYADQLVLSIENNVAITYSSAISMIQQVSPKCMDLIQATKALVDPADWDELHRISRAVLLVNGEHYTVWNARKRRLVALTASLAHAELTTLYQEELDFVTVLLSKHPKSREAFAQRRWVLKQQRKGIPLSACLAELEVCARASARYPKNYFAWSHRQWVVEHAHTSDQVALLTRELSWSREWISSHVSDHSGMHYRHSLILFARQLCLDVDIVDEVKWAEELNAFYEGHEALTCYRLALSALKDLEMQ